MTTLSGRHTTPFPKWSKKAKSPTGKIDRWLLENAALEAEARGDDFNAPAFRAELNQKTIPQASKDSAEEYLFGWQPDAPKKITKPLAVAQPENSQLTDDQIAARTKPVGEEGDANTLRWHASEDAANRYAKVRGYGEYHVRKINGQYVAVPDTVSKPLTAAPTATQEKANEVQKRQEKAGPVETPQEQAAVHIEGNEQETVTPAVVADAVEKGADKVDRPTPEIRKQLVADIEHRLRLAQEEAKLDGNAEGLLKPTEISSAEYDFVTFNVPGDGKFKVKNKPENLEKFLKQVKRTPAFAGEPPKTPSSGLRLGPIAETIKEFSESSDPDDIKNAIELLRLQGKKSETSPLIEKLRNLGVDAGYDVTPADEYTPKYPSATKLGISNSSNRLWFPVRVKGKVVWGTGHMIDVTPPPTKKKIETIPYDRAAPIARDSLAEFFENGPDNLKDADYTIPPYNKTKDKAVFVGSIGEYAISVARNQLYYYDEAYYGYFAKKYPNAALYITKDEGRLIFEDGGDFVGVLAGIYEDRVDAGIKEAAKSLLDTPKPAQKEVEARKQDRRKDTAKRKRVNEMSPEEMRRELLIDPLTGLGNRRAFEEMLEDSPPAYLASIDADSLKWINDNMSPNTGDALLKAVGNALKTVDADNAYHISGDEYYLTGESEAALQAALDKVDAALADVTLEIEKPTEIIELKGLRITYGFGQDKETADTALKQAKRDREQAGERASRGETPKGVQRQPKGVSEPTATGGQAEGEVTPKADESAAPAEETKPRPASPGVVEHGESAPAPGKLPEQDSVIAGSVRLSDAIHKWMYDKANRGKKMSWRVFQRLANEAYGGKQSDGAWDIKQAYDAMELFFNKDVVGGKKGGASNSTPSQVKVQIGMYEDVQSRLPTQTRRSEEQQALQQFSTPHTHSHAVAWVAGIKPDDIVLEPSAGTGNLAAHAWQFGPDKIYANELSEYRASMLKQLKKLDAVMTENAQHIHAVFPKNLDKPTVIVMNPPFSANALKKGSKDLEEGARHVESALKLLADNGRLVAILGRGMALDKPRMKKVWARIKKDYNVRAVIGIDGEAYRKFGTSFDNVIAVIDKTGPTTDKPLTGDVKKIDELIPLLQSIHDDRAPLPDSRRQQSEDQPSRAQSAAPSKGKTKSGKSLRGAVDAVGVTQQQVPGQQKDGAGATGGAGGAGSATRASDGESVTGRAGQGDGASTDSSDKPGGAGKRSAGATRKQDKRSGSVVSSPLDQPGTVSFKSNKGTSKAVGQSTFDSYVPAYSFSSAQDHPAILAESAAMASVQPPKLEYQPNLPEAVIADGRLSNAQLQTIAYAGQAHSKILPGGKFRRGYFIGDGTGVGKGAQIAGIILDNWRQGRRKAVWVSENEGLRPDAKRDAEWAGLGGKNIIKAPTGSEDINNEQGILFTTYSTLKNASREIKDANGNIIKPSVTRLDQIVNWLGEDFDGVIAFDESHNMRNAMDFKGKRGVAKASITALAGIDLQQRLPNARVVYVSATGATEVRNLAYAERLGLWGEGTPFGNKQEFVSEIESGGVAAMEVVAKDLKSMGIYQARSISFEGVEYDTVQQVMTPEQKQIYNKIADTWQIILQNVDEAMEDSGSDKDGRARSAALSAFWGNQQRFFNQLITAMQVPALIKSIEAELENGNSAVLQLVNTDEALMKRRIAQAEDAGMDLDDVDFTPRDIMMQYLAKSFPTTMYEEYTDENGNQRTRPVLNSAGDPVENPKAVEMRDKLLEDLGGLDVPDGALNQLLSYFGKDAVAEITGRSTRVIRDENGKVVLEKFTQAMKARDEKAFQDGKKRILVFSDAGGTGRSYHASNTFKNQQKRIHYLVQPGWRADKAVQGFGRTHRTNQASPPEYRLVTTDLVAQARFLSSIARRLDQLGALTKGQRDTANQGLFDAEANLENEYGESALEVFIDDLYHDRMPEVGARDEIAKQLGFRLFDDDGNSRDLKVSVPQFLNRTLSLRTDMMEKVFGKFMDNLRSIIQYAKENNMYDTGMQIFSSDGVNVLSITKDHEDVVRDKGDGVTKYIRFLVEKPTQLKAWADIPETAKFYRNNRSQILYAVYDDGRATDPKTGRILTRVAISTPIKTRSRLGDIGLITYREFPSDRASEVDRGDAKKLWEQAYKSAPKTVTENYHMITGALLPIWDRLPRGDLNEVLRVTDDSGERVVGRRIKEKDLNRTLKNLGIAQDVPKLSPKEWADRLLNEGSTLVLANNWKLKRARVAGEYRIEIVGPTNNDYNTLKEQGAFTEIIQYKTRVFVPAKNTSEILGRIIDSKPVVEVEGQAKYSQTTKPVNPQTETAAFKRWFGDSVVVDENGAPLVLYHATSADILSFDPKAASIYEDAKSAIFLTTDTDVAETYLPSVWYTPDGKNVEKAYGDGANIMPVYVKIENPMVVDYFGGGYKENEFADLIKEAKKEGHDGVFFKNVRDPGIGSLGRPKIAHTVVAFKPTQIKSATGNKGTFSPRKADIRHSQAQTTGTTTAAVREALNLTPKAKKALLDSQRVRIVQSVSEIPGNHPDDVAGAYHEGAIWLVADNLTRQDAHAVLLHEVVHAELSKMPEFKKILADVEAGIRRGGKPFVEARNTVPRGTPAEHVTEETLAYLVQNNPRLPIVRRLIAAIRAALRKLGLVENYTADDMVRLAHVALKRMAGGERATRINDVLFDDSLIKIKAKHSKAGGGSMDGDEYVTLYHGSPDVITEINSSGLFEGVFASSDKAAAESHMQNGVLHEIKLRESDILTQQMLDYELDYEQVKSALTAEMPRLSEDDIDLAYEVVVEDKDVFDMDAEDVERIFGYEDIGEASWEAQRIRGRVAKALGYKAVEMSDEHGSSILVLPGADIRPFDRPQPLYSRRANTPDDAESLLREFDSTYQATPRLRDSAYKTWDSVKNMARNKRRAWLGLLTRQQIVDVGKDVQPQAEMFERLARQKDADENQLVQEHADTLKAWSKRISRFAGKKDNAQMALLARTMHEATIAGFDPDKDSASTPDEKRLARAWDALDANSKQLYRDVRDAYSKRRDELEMALAVRIAGLDPLDKTLPKTLAGMYERAFNKLSQDAQDGTTPSRRQTLAMLRASMESNRVKGPYFPLSRFGDYYVTAEKAGEEKQFLMTESPAEWRRMQKELRADGWTVRAGKKIENLATEVGPGINFMQDVFSIVEGSDASIDEDTMKAMKDDLWQMYLRTLPDQSIRKHYIHRQNRRGFSQDAFRAFAHHVGHSSKQIARLRYSGALGDTLDAMKANIEGNSDPEKAADIADALNKSYQWMMAPNTARWAQRATSLGFAWYLGVSPAAAAINLTQTPIVTFPVLSARYGTAKAGRELMRAMKDYGANLAPGKWDAFIARSGDLGRALKDLEDSGAIDRTLTLSMLGMDSENVDLVKTQSSMMRYIGWFFHQAERANREITAIAAYRLARDVGRNHDQAVQAAYNAIYESHFDYSSGNRAQFMRSNTARILLLFRQFSQNMVYVLWRNAQQSLKGATPEARTEARKKLTGILGMTALFSGVMGLPLMSSMLWVAQAAHDLFADDDDEEWDAELALRGQLAEWLGPAGGAAVARGALGAGIGSRTGLNDLILRSPDRDLEGKALAAYYLEQAAGPLAGIGINAFRGAELMSQGQFYRGFEAMTPKAIKDVMRTIRYGQEGVQSLRGDPIVARDDISYWELFMQLNGLAPHEVIERYEQNNNLKRLEQKILNRRRSLLNAYYMAWRDKDRDSMREIKRKMAGFNKAYPEARITPQSVSRSFKARVRASRENQDGMVYNKSLRPLLQEQRYAA